MILKPENFDWKQKIIFGHWNFSASLLDQINRFVAVWNICRFYVALKNVFNQNTTFGRKWQNMICTPSMV